ncbi:exodeoxyribonuclease I [Alteromonas sediminis]|uniref:Exodeoxyribonuclease I n=1 Tax=Alteromonas sediminis TaxID=2259342 RepID=A0A3N5ZBZ8_9ALTE|nr:exodeoxyribonuclease I [Alteromonas sediminis]RPJ67278.1 exodeoxyribonuclease I [Alteromonas sediminis]
MAHANTFLFHDYETWGVKPNQDYPCQFAAIRTDENFEPIEAPIDIMCRIPNDYLPSPQACLVTGITPQKSLQKGLIEADFAAQIYQQMAQPGTCSLGYNSIRFDDEVSRHLFFRNFYDPYAREWQNGNSRWDLIDLARACYALRPEGINWPVSDKGTPSFKLEHLTVANDIHHEGAHDALVDVYATIGLAKKLKSAQPKLFDYAFQLKNKHHVWQQISLDTLTPILHVSSKVPASQGCCTYILPVAVHPKQPNAVICIDLSKDLTPLYELDVEALRTSLYASSDGLVTPQSRPGIKLIHVNKSPFITSAKALSEQRAEQIGLDRHYCLENYKKLKDNPLNMAKLVALFDTDYDGEEQDVEQSLYSGGFLTQEEKYWCEAVRESSEHQLVNLQNQCQNIRLRTLLYRYRARNFPQTLSHEEAMQWQQHRMARLEDGSGTMSAQAYLLELENLAETYANQPATLKFLQVLYQYAQNL